MKSRKESNIEATRAALLGVARRHFARYGYSGAQIGQIAREARATSGAIYHHFSNKKSLFLAVAEDLEREILHAAAAIEHPDPWTRLILGFDKMIDICATSPVQRIIFIEAPQVAGPEAWRKIELQYAFGALRSVLAALREANVIKPLPIDLVAGTLLAILREASAELVRSKHDVKVRAQLSDLARAVFNIFLQS